MPPDPVPFDVIVTPAGTPAPVIVMPTRNVPETDPVSVRTLLTRVQVLQLALATQHRLYAQLVRDIALEALHERHTVLAGRAITGRLHAL